MKLICTSCAHDHNAQLPRTVCDRCGKPLEVDYEFSPGDISIDTDLEEVDSLWRYAALLPSIDAAERVSLGEGRTPLITVNLNGQTIYLKDETGNPTGSFKDRGLCLALTMALHHGYKKVALPSAGNAAVSASAYAQAAGLSCKVYMPDTIPKPFVAEIEGYGATVVLAGNSIAEAGKAMAADLDESWFNLSTLKEPYRVEGKKTMGLEIGEQLGWRPPDVVIYPAGGGTGLVGIYKALGELRQLGLIAGNLPRMVAIQTAGCAPVVRAFDEGATDTVAWENGHTSALGLNVPSPLGGAWMLKVIRESGGTALAVAEGDLANAGVRLRHISGIPAGPEAAAAWLGLESLRASGWVTADDRVVVVITGDNRRY